MNLLARVKRKLTKRRRVTVTGVTMYESANSPEGQVFWSVFHRKDGTVIPSSEFWWSAN